jgi:eukaryotic-like serine/threonine-protein kinase
MVNLSGTSLGHYKILYLRGGGWNGCLLYEMISAHQPFLTDSKATTMSAILNQTTQPLARYSREIPAELERIVSKALAKAKEERYQTIKDLLIDINTGK